jgi:hypothetical protein
VSVQNLRLKDNHTWKARPGYSICVIDRGVARFDYPSDWTVKPGDGAVHLHDGQPSVESADLGVSIFRVPREIVADVVLDEMLLDSLDDEEVYERSEVRRVDRPDIDIVWVEQRYVDEDFSRDARRRIGLARGLAICLITMNYWTDRAEAIEEVWDEVLRTFVIGIRVDDPTVGPWVQ